MSEKKGKEVDGKVESSRPKEATSAVQTGYHYRTGLDMARDRAQVARLYLQGRNIAEIAAETGRSTRNIHQDLATLERQWRLSAVRDLDSAKAEEIARINLLEQVYWEAWEVSKQERRITDLEQRVDNSGSDGAGSGILVPARGSVRREQRDGNPAFLEGVRWCIERRCRLLGLDSDSPAVAVFNQLGGNRGLDEDSARLFADLVANGLSAGSGGSRPATSEPEDWSNLPDLGSSPPLGSPERPSGLGRLASPDPGAGV